MNRDYSRETLMTWLKFKALKKMIFTIIITGLVLTSLGVDLLKADENRKVDFSYPSGQKQSQPAFKAKHYVVKAATSEIKIDGLLDEQAWSKATLIKLPYEWRPGDNIPAPVDTDCLVTFDKNFLYIGFRCYDPNPSQIRAHLMDRDATDTLIQDDHVVILIDPFNDERRGFQFRANPFGVQADANFSEMEGYEDFSWDAIWNSAGKITDWGYSVEIAIPFNQIRFPRTSEVQTWGFSAERSYPRSVRHRMISHKRERNIACILCQMNKISGFQGMSPGYNLEFDPTLTSVRTDRREQIPQGSMEAGKIKPEPGITARWGVTPNLILNATLNPDFSQVEADVAQLEVNTRFAIRYPEKRPFFLEGADFFLTPLEAVFTRTVADPAGGFKLTGKIGKNAVGFFGTYDRMNNLLFPSNQGSLSTSLEQDVTGGVFRYRRDVGRSSTFGFLYSGRMAEDYYNHVAGVDGFFRLSRTKSLNFQYLHSQTRYPDNIASVFNQDFGTFGGDAFVASFLHVGRSWRYGGAYQDLSPSFRADSGYIPRVDTRRANGMVQRIFWGKKGDWYTLLGLTINGLVTYNHDKKLTDQNLSISGLYQGPLQSTLQISFNQNKELYVNRTYDLSRVSFYSEIKPSSGLCFNLLADYGEAVDYHNLRQANSLNLMPLAELGLGRHVNINLQHSFQRLALKGKKIFVANLSQVRLIYNFSVRAFARAIVQYLDVSRNPELYFFPISKKTQTIFTQFLFSYKINPQTVFFIGYSDNYLGMTGIDVTQTDRTFFVKLGYAWTK